MTIVAKLLGQRSHLVPGKLKVTEFFFEVPKDYARPDAGNLRLFARSAEKSEKPVNITKDEVKQLPWFVYLQGGPGGACRPPQHVPWTDCVLDRGYKILLMDQRGTGMSTTITADTLAKIGGPAEQAAYLKLFRADSIVKDAEAIRKCLTADYSEDKKKWSILGQSFGGFCCTNYLSRFPEGLREVFTTGGLPPLVKQPDEVYETLFKRVAQRSLDYYKKFPEDIQRVKALVDYLTRYDIKTYSGGNVSVDRLRGLGINFGAHGGMDNVHDLILRMTSDLEMFESLTRPTIQAFDNFGPFDTSILYALVHEPCYLSGSAGNWSAQRIMSKLPEFKISSIDSKDPVLFTAEMILKSMYNDYSELRSLLPTANLLAETSDWPDLYDEAQLERNEVPVYSATYLDDLYVDFDYAQATARKIKGCKVFVTNTMYHNALGAKSDEVMKELFKLRDDVID